MQTLAASSTTILVGPNIISTDFPMTEDFFLETKPPLIFRHIHFRQSTCRAHSTCCDARRACCCLLILGIWEVGDEVCGLTGMMGTIPSGVRSGLLELFYGVYQKDPDRCIDALITMGVLVPGGDRMAIRRTAEFFLKNFQVRSTSAIFLSSPCSCSSRIPNWAWKGETPTLCGWRWHAVGRERSFRVIAPAQLRSDWATTKRVQVH